MKDLTKTIVSRQNEIFHPLGLGQKNRKTVRNINSVIRHPSPVNYRYIEEKQ